MTILKNHLPTSRLARRFQQNHHVSEALGRKTTCKRPEHDGQTPRSPHFAALGRVRKRLIGTFI